MEALVEQLTKHFDQHASALQSALEKTAAKVDQTAQKADEAVIKAASTDADLVSFKQRIIAARGGGSFGGAEQKSIGQQFSESDELRVFRETRSRPSRVRLELSAKTITSATGSGGATVVPARGATEMMARQQLRIVDLLPQVSVTTGSIEYAKQSTRSILAATVAEGALKPESDIAFTLTTVPIRTVAHWIGIARQVLEDSEQLRGLVDTELLFGVRLKEEQEVVSGDGTGTHILGLIPSAAAFVAPITVPTPTSIDVLGTAILQVALANFMPNAIVIHPSDLARIRLQKDSTGRYIISDNPAVGMPPSLFGVGLVPSLGISPDKFLVLDTQAAATVYRRTQPIVEASSEHSDFFVRNLVALLAESRLGLAVRSPTAMAYGDFGVIA